MPLCNQDFLVMPEMPELMIRITSTSTEERMPGRPHVLDPDPEEMK